MFISSMQPKSKRKVILAASWGAVAVCMAVIFFLSHDTAAVSAEKSNGFIALLLKKFGIAVSSHVIRKTAHVLEYCGLALLLYNACFQTFSAPQPLLCMLTAVLYAASDEIHQYFILGRACQMRDVFIDFVGAAVGTAVCTAIWYIFRRIQKKRGINNGSI